MLRSKSLLNLKFVFSVATSAALLSACTLPKSSPADPSKTSNATFYVASSEITVTTQKLDSNVSVPVSKTFSFKVCVKDNRLSQTIVNHKFEIQTEGDPIEKFTDAAGCLVWSEDIGYNHLAPAHYLELIRTIRAEGYQKGERSLRFAIDPWENQAESLMDKNREDLVPYKDLAMTLQGVSSKDSAELAHPVWVDDLRLTVYEKQMSAQGMVLDFLIRTSPSIVMISNTGERILQPLTYGEFDTEISLIHVVSENQKQVRRLLTAPVKTKGTMAEGYLSIEAPITLNEVCTRGQVEIGLKLIPKNAPKNLLPFEGVFVGNDCDQIKGSSFNRLTNTFQEAKGKMTIQDYLTDASIPGSSSLQDTNTGKVSGAGAAAAPSLVNQDYYQSGKIIVLPLAINGIGYLDQHTIERVRLFRVTACMSGPLDLKALRNQSFHITKVNGDTADVVTNLQGCLYWDDSYKFNFLENESWKETSIHISNKNLGFDQALTIHINPWGPTDNTAFRDIRNFDPQGQTLYVAKGKSQIILNSYSYDKLSFDYAMDSFLGLSMKKNVLFKLTPRIKRPSLTDPSGFAEEALPIGAYALRWAVVDMSVNDASQAKGKIYQVDERLVLLNANSTIAETLALQTADIHNIANTNKILIELFPLKENAVELKRQNPKLSLDQLADDKIQMTHSVYAGALILSNNNDGTTLVPFKDGDASIMPALTKQFQDDQAAKIAEAQKFARKDVYAATNSLVTFDLYDQARGPNFRANLAYAHRYASYPALYHGDIDNAATMNGKVNQWLKTGIVTRDMQNKLCDFLAFEILRNPRNQKNIFSAKAASELDLACRENPVDTDAQSLFIRYSYFLKNPSLIKMDSPEMRDVSISTGFSMTKGVSDSVTYSASLSAGIGAKGVLPMAPFIGGSLGGNLSISKSHSENTGYGSQQSFSTGVSLTLERVTATIRADSFEKCATVKLGSLFSSSDLMEYAESGTTRADMDRTLSKGLLVCSQPTGPATIDENYYVLNQRMPYSTIIDPASSQSRPFFAFLRGDTDLNRLMTYLEASYETPAAGQASDVNKEMAQKKMRNIFEILIPTYPGQIVREH